MSNEKRNVETEEIKEARELTEEELEKVNGGVARKRADVLLHRCKTAM